MNRTDVLKLHVDTSRRRDEVIGVFCGPAELEDGPEQGRAPHRRVSWRRADHPQRAALPDRSGVQQALQHRH